MQTYLVLFSGYTSVEMYTRRKGAIVSNKNLAQCGMRLHIDKVINIRQNSLSWGQYTPRYDCMYVLISSYNVIADVVEALVGSVCFYRTPQDAIRVVGFILNMMDYVPSLIYTFERGYLSGNLMRLFQTNSHFSTTKNGRLVTTDFVMHQVNTLCRIQQYLSSFVVT